MEENTGKDLEKILLGTVILEAQNMDSIMAQFNQELFEVPEHKLIAKAVIELHMNQEPVDLVTLTEKIHKNSDLEKIGGAYYLSTLTNRIGSTANAEYHLRILQEHALKRKVVRICTEATSKMFSDGVDVFDAYESLQKKLETTLKGVMSFDLQTIGNVHTQSLLEAREVARTGQSSGIPTGLELLDNTTNGWQKSDLIILAGRPSMGKTAAAVTMCLYPALERDIPIAIFSLEMSATQLVGRMQSGLSEIDVSRIIKKQISEEEVMHIANKAVKLQNAPLYIDDTPSLSILEFKAKARRLVREHGVQMIVVDYLQLMTLPYKTKNREQEIAQISMALKATAKELDVPVIALSQLSRSVEGRGGDKKPMLSDLRESGQIEQDADLVIFCYRPEYYQIQEYELGGDIIETRGLFLFLVAKHRNGELGEIPLRFKHQFTKIINHENYCSQKEFNCTFVQEQEDQIPLQTGISPNKDFDNINKDETNANDRLSGEEYYLESSEDHFTRTEEDEDLPF